MQLQESASRTELGSTVDLVCELKRIDDQCQATDRTTEAVRYQPYIIAAVVLFALAGALRFTARYYAQLMPFFHLTIVLIYLLAYYLIAIGSIVPLGRWVLRPAPAFALRLDRYRESEDILAGTLRRIPAEVLLERRKRIQSELDYLEWYANVTRLLGLVAPIVALFKDSWFLLTLLVSATIVVSVAQSYGIRQLRRIAYVLEKASDQNHPWHWHH